MSKKVIHLLPYDGIGGVETAARSMLGIEHDQIDFQIEYIFHPATSISHRVATFNPLKVLSATRRIFSQNPDLLIVSLWRSCIVGVLVKLLRPRLRLVLFLHLPNHVHWVDRISTQLAAMFSSRILADSKETLAQRLPDISAEGGRVISFVTHHIPMLAASSVSPVFIFWGRIHQQKGLDRALRIVALVRKVYPNTRFLIIGPDGGDRFRIEGLVTEMGLSSVVSFLGGMDFKQIIPHARTASFYLQTSLFEGMAMSVVEAMQLGLVPVVTPVGEIGTYGRHGENALIVHSDEVVVNEIFSVLSSNKKYIELRKNAAATWETWPTYSESVLLACEEIFSTACEHQGCVG